MEEQSVNATIHHVVSIDTEEPTVHIDSQGQEYYCREIIVTSAKGRERITLYADTVGALQLDGEEDS
jgi:hypothetical protein